MNDGFGVHLGLGGCLQFALPLYFHKSLFGRAYDRALAAGYEVFYGTIELCALLVASLKITEIAWVCLKNVVAHGIFLHPLVSEPLVECMRRRGCFFLKCSGGRIDPRIVDGDGCDAAGPRANGFVVFDSGTHKFDLMHCNGWRA